LAPGTYAAPATSSARVTLALVGASHGREVPRAFALNEDKSSRYHRLRRRAEVCGTAAAGLLLLWLLLSGYGSYLREVASFTSEKMAGYEEVGTTFSYGVILFVLLQLTDAPFAFYQGYVLEHRYGLSNQRPRVWLLDQLKATGVGLVLAALATSVIYAALRAAPDWWWAVSAAVFALAVIVLAQLAPVVLLPLFYTVKPLDRPVLTEKLVALAKRARAPVMGVYEWALSAHTKKANAALAGLGRTRRVLLSDTLLASYTDDEIEVVLAHELAHHVHHDLWRGIAVQTGLLFVAFYVAHLALDRFADALVLRGADDPAGLPLIVLVGGACAWVFMPLANAVSRAAERRADREALALTGHPEAFVSAMKRLGQQNLAEEHPSRLVQWLFYSHPPIRERIEAARRWRASGPQVTAARDAIEGGVA
jgi:STE24 endopeptidase